MKTIKKVSITIILFLSLCLSIFSVTADPTIEIETNPANPERLSTFTVIADITGENIISVKVTISECDDSVCYVSQSNIPMDLNEDGNYETEITLTGTQESINHVQYVFIINDSGTEYQIKDFKTNLNTDGANNGGGDNGSPGFELILILASVSILLIIFKKRDKK